MPIDPISSMPIRPVTSPAGSSAPAAGAESAAGMDFAQVLQKSLQHVNNDQQASTQAIQDLMVGNNEDVLPVVSAVAQADLSFKLLMGVRNKVIEAYKQTMNMQI